MPSPGRALLDWDAPLFDVDDMIGVLPDMVSDDLVADYVFGTSVYSPPIILDYTWLVPPLAWRPTPPVNSQTVSRTGGATAYGVHSASVAELGTFDPGQVTLETIIDADATSLATYNTTYQATYLQRPPQLTFDLIQRTTTEIWRILSVTEGARIIIANTPAGWPAECVSVFVDGIAHTIGLDARLVVFTCSPLIGVAAGAVGPWFTAGTSMAGGTDVVPF